MPFAKIMSFEQFAAQSGAAGCFGDPGLHNPAGHIPSTTWKRLVERQARLDEALADRRGELRAEYKRLVAEGHIIEPDSQQRLEAAAEGESAQAAAARRILAKKAARKASV